MSGRQARFLILLVIFAPLLLVLGVAEGIAETITAVRSSWQRFAGQA